MLIFRFNVLIEILAMKNFMELNGVRFDGSLEMMCTAIEFIDDPVLINNVNFGILAAMNPQEQQQLQDQLHGLNDHAFMNL